MTLGDKALELLFAKTDDERFAATAKLTDKQKDIVIVSLVKVIQEKGFNMSEVEL